MPIQLNQILSFFCHFPHCLKVFFYWSVINKRTHNLLLDIFSYNLLTFIFMYIFDEDKSLFIVCNSWPHQSFSCHFQSWFSYKPSQLCSYLERSAPHCKFIIFNKIYKFNFWKGVNMVLRLKGLRLCFSIDNYPTLVVIKNIICHRILCRRNGI